MTATQTSQILLPLLQDAHTETADKITVTPEMARQWLLSNVLNRNVSFTSVEKYRIDMLSGQWKYAADPIRFSTEGNLIDGQHRLIALAGIPDDAGIAIAFLVVCGLPPESQKYMDQGSKRTAGQQLSLVGIKNANAVAAAARVFLIWKSGLLFKDNKLQQLITVVQVQKWVEDNPERVTFESQIHRWVHLMDAPSSVASAAAFQFADIDREQAVEFFHLLSSGAGLVEGSPILALDKRLRRVRKEGLKVSTRDYLAFFILAWNAWREDRQMTKFQRPAGGTWSEANFPIAK